MTGVVVRESVPCFFAMEAVFIMFGRPNGDDKLCGVGNVDDAVSGTCCMSWRLTNWNCSSAGV